MKRQDVVETIRMIIANKLDVKLTKKAAREITDEIFDAILQGSIEDGEVVLPNIGKLKLQRTAPRSGKKVMPDGSVKEWSKPEGKTIRLRLSSKVKERLK